MENKEINHSKLIAAKPKCLTEFKEQNLGYHKFRYLTTPSVASRRQMDIKISHFI